MITRILFEVLQKNLKYQKVTLLLGARRVGKTELLQALYKSHESNALWLNGEDGNTLELLQERTISNYKNLIGDKSILIIDEAQFVPDVARIAKLMIDTIKPLHIILTGSSAFELEQNSAPLTGRTLTRLMYPLSQWEWSTQENRLQTLENLHDRIIFGSYPEISTISDKQSKIFYLNELVNTYLLKDILIFEQLKNAKILKDLLLLLAYQIGSEVSVNELANQLRISKNTVLRYLDILRKAFIIFPLGGYSNNLRKEVVKSSKYYFYDNGVRNALMGDFSPFAMRKDVGALWEQYFIHERLKFKEYQNEVLKHFFWRTYDQQEIDLIELENANLSAFECKWKPSNSKVPKAFEKAYPNASFIEINSKNYLEYITPIAE